MIAFIEQAQFYAAYHKNATTRLIHMISVPLILLSAMILLGFVRVVILGVLDINLADIATLGLLIYYFRLNWRLALALIPLLVILLLIAEFFSSQGPTAFSLWSFVIILIFGGVLQFIGHFIEGKRPELADHFQHLLIAPLFLVAEIFFMTGHMGELKTELHSKEHAEIPNAEGHE